MDIDAYRPNVGVVLFNREGLVWYGQRHATPGPHNWQFPQGGVDAGEDLEAAREAVLVGEPVGHRDARHAREAGVFRVNYRTGEMSICFVLVKKEQVVCTQQANPAAEGAADAPLTGPVPGRAGASATPPQGGRP